MSEHGDSQAPKAQAPDLSSRAAPPAAPPPVKQVRHVQTRRVNLVPERLKKWSVGDFFIDNLLVRKHFVIEMIWWTGLAP